MKDKLGRKKPIVSVIGIMLAVMMCFGISLSSSQTVYAADGDMVIEEKTDDTVKERDSKKDEKSEVRYPNKLSPKSISTNSEFGTSTNGNEPQNNNKGVVTPPSKARGTVTENKDNTNKDYPIYDEESENVMLLTEVSEDDLLNMIEKKEEDSAIRDGFNHLKDGSYYDNLFESAKARAIADWLVGMNISRLYSCLYKQNYSVGRVQTPTLAMIVNRDEEISKFKKEKYYTVDVLLDGVTRLMINRRLKNFLMKLEVTLELKKSLVL